MNFYIFISYFYGDFAQEFLTPENTFYLPCNECSILNNVFISYKPLSACWICPTNLMCYHFVNKTITSRIL